ncbi:MAG TPA: SRPBCC domain-containing protein [Bacteroidia bacterium]|jgi:uncharacterized protein YndB with AHSA1/START domain|nr:SRPBCC domain-containing protein [Bacteroidia bacterium]
MELKTKIKAEDGKQELTITREFDLPVELLFKAHADPEIIEQVMTNPYTTAKILKFEGKKHGSYQMESTDANGKVVFRANGTIHEFTPDKKITRTFEMENAQLGVQLEIYEFEKLTESTSRLNTHIIYESVALRDKILKSPFAQGLSMAHDRILEIMKKLK